MRQASPFLWVGNHPAPDLCNTTPVVDGGPVDLLTDVGLLARWLDEAGIATAVGLDLLRAVLAIFGHDGRLVRRCANPACVLLFLDISKSGRRRWCDMATCGNRAKAAAHYHRHHTTRPRR